MAKLERDFLSRLVATRQGATVSKKGKEGSFRWDTRKKCCTMRLVRHWPRLSRKIVDALSLKVVETASGLTEGVAVHGMVLDWVVFEGLFQPKPFYHSLPVFDCNFP